MVNYSVGSMKWDSFLGKLHCWWSLCRTPPTCIQFAVFSRVTKVNKICPPSSAAEVGDKRKVHVRCDEGSNTGVNKRRRSSGERQ